MPFTISHRWGTDHLPGLTRELAGLPLFKWLQFGSGAIGLVVLTWCCVRWLRRARPDPAMLAEARQQRAAWVTLAVVLLATIAITTIDQAANASWLEAAVFAIVTTTMGVLAGAVVVICLLWQLPHSLGTGSAQA